MSVKICYCCPCGCKSEISRQIVSAMDRPALCLNCRQIIDADVLNGLNLIIRGLELAGDQVSLSNPKEKH